MRLQGIRVCYFIEEGFEDLEFWVPVMRLREEGARVVVVGTSAAHYTGKNGLKANADTSADAVNPDDFDAVVIPGGWAPDKLRRYDSVLNIVRRANEQGKIVGAICHAGWVPISAGIVRGRRATGSRAIKDDLVNAGATWVDESAFRDGNQVWGRVVEDIPNFCRELVTAIEEWARERQPA
ncbi:MAG: type 1 glutamine amidotransferase [Anaerolineae bacterium]|nr:type 1 glutamine amidotransferase [Anaerolineae bacterium]